MFAGKDYVAKSAGLTIKGFADPIYQICEYFNGTSDKAVPGVRKFMQQIGQWGWGCVSDAYPFNMERAAISQKIRELGHTMTKDFKWVAWSEFGRRQDFWVNIALTRLGLTGHRFSMHGQSFLFPEFERTEAAYNLAITNSRFDHELSPCKNVGFTHFHVRCSESTRRDRMLISGYEFKDGDDNDASEAMAKRLDMDMPEHLVVWNDTEPMPSGKRYLTTQEFVDLVRGQNHFEEPKTFYSERLAVPWTEAAHTMSGIPA